MTESSKYPSTQYRWEFMHALFVHPFLAAPPKIHPHKISAVSSGRAMSLELLLLTCGGYGKKCRQKKRIKKKSLRQNELKINNIIKR